MKLIHGDSLEKLKDLASNSIDSIVTDPPYGWRFMGKAWDAFDIEQMAEKDTAGQKWTVRPNGKPRAPRKKTSEAAGTYNFTLEGNQAFMHWTKEWATEALRVLKPGGHMLVFCGPRTYHAMAMGVELAGFEIRDQLQWVFGSGFPKSLDVSKAIDKAAGAEREVVGSRDVGPDIRGDNYKRDSGERMIAQITAPATPEAKRWQGWGTALKPSNEPIVLARKPLEKGLTVAENVLKWGTGALAIDACRIGTETRQSKTMKSGTGETYGKYDEWNGEYKSVTGRWPANLILDEAAADEINSQTGRDVAKYFYCEKASKKERNAGLDDLPKLFTKTMNGGIGGREHNPDEPTAYNQNHHPTVKPIKLMQYLITLVTPPGGVVLDPFMGSGTTGCAAVKLDFQFFGIEREKEYIKISRKRIKHWAKST